MTSKTSFFNKGIYKSTVKRYAWGSILYFIILFVSTGLSVFLNADSWMIHMPYDYFKDYSVILHGQYIVLPVLLAIVVPTIVALLIFRNIHSKKQAIFIHSLPVSRRANYISSLLAGITLMVVPILLNTLLLVLISVFGYGNYFTPTDCFIWMKYNIVGVLMMFSCAVFAASLTGNSFAAVAINILIHSFLFITVTALNIMAEVFIYGFTEGNIVYESILKNNFAVVVYGFMDRTFRGDITNLKIIEYLLISLALYVISYFLYKKRRLETATDVAAYKCLNHIFKYLVTFVATMLGFAGFAYYIGNNVVIFAVIVAIISLIAYTASEMVLKKTVNVLYSWKGYAGFALFFVVLTCFFSHTSFFGYETRVPDRSAVKEVSVFSFYYQDEEPFTADGEIIDYTLKLHEGFVQQDSIPKIKYSTAYYSNGNVEEYTNIHIKYKLANGQTMYRMYPVPVSERTDIMNTLYENEEYKKLCEEVFVDDSLITGVRVYNGSEKDGREGMELLNVIREDILSLSFEEIHPEEYGKYGSLYNVEIEYKRKSDSGDEESVLDYRVMEISEKYEKTVKYLEDKGYERFFTEEKKN